MNTKKILIYGAGAIGRGFLAPVFDSLKYEIYFVDKNIELINNLKKRNFYKTAFSENKKYDIVNVKYSKAFILGEEEEILNDMDFVFSCVGPDNIKEFAHKLKNVPAIISFENDIESVDTIKKLSNNKNCYFGIPDVITSNTSSDYLKKIDPLCLVSEKGELAIERGDYILHEKISTHKREELEKYWNCKFYLHNAPHAAAAFLGKLCQVEYIHEAMSVPLIEFVVASLMDSTKNAMKIKKMADPNFIDIYSRKEIKRFKDNLLLDPISRVGRDPLRKLRANDRLIQSARFISSTDQDINSICIVIKSAIYDAIKNYNKDLYNILKKEPTEELILKEISNLDENDEIFKEITKKNIFNMIFSSLLKQEIKRIPKRDTIKEDFI
jgi:mannitol-1-phosphate 5-dehydrogenase